MRKIKSFKLFESKSEIDVDSICSLYEDVKSIEYILEKRGISPSYRSQLVKVLLSVIICSLVLIS